MGEEIVSLEEIHYQFWNEFVNKVFNDSEFKNDFNYRKSWNKSYYDLFWGNKDLHLCVRHNIKESYVSVEIYITENEEVFNYLQTNKNEIEKLYGKKLTFTKAKGKVGKAKKIYDVYMDGETSEKNNWSKYIKWIRDTALKMKKIVEIFYKNLDKDINFNEITYEREVISIPAADTINLIYKYGIHAHPNDYNRYPYKKSLFYTFREKNGVMTRLYELNTTVILNPNKISEIDNLDIDIFIKEKLNSATGLVKSIESRKSTILKIAKEIVKNQKDFFDKGEKYIKPMKMKDIAQNLDFHESTISRGVNGKYMLTPFGIYEFKYFFSSALETNYDNLASSVSIKRMIQETIKSENKKKPLSDDQISKILNDRGINIARRTIAKYREELGILSSSKRKQY